MQTMEEGKEVGATMKEACENCEFCKDFYIPPRRNFKARHEYCCTLFLQSDNSVMYLGNDIKSLCECFTERSNHER